MRPPNRSKNPPELASEQYNLTDLSLDRLRRRRSAKWTAWPPDVLPAFVAEMDFPLAQPVKDALTRAIELDDTGYANPDGSGLAAAFTGFAGRRFGWEVDPGQVTATTDVVGGLRALLDLVAGPQEGVIINPPVYFPFFSIVPEAGRELVEVPLREGGRLDLEAIGRAFEQGARAMILCSPHNPTGTVPTRDELEQLAELAMANDAWVLADEIHAPLTLSGATHVPFLDVSDAARECGICVTSASKTFNIAGLVCALVVTASERARQLVSGLPVAATHPGHLGVIASQAAFESGDDWLDQVVAQLDLSRHLLADLLAEHLPAAEYQEPEAGYLAWINANGLGLGPDPATEIFDRARVAVSSGPGFGRGGEGYFRLNIGTSPNLIEAAVRSIAEIT
jgi:cystathionine beta-lyase